jgi:hypothetical protein
LERFEAALAAMLFPQGGCTNRASLHQARRSGRLFDGIDELAAGEARRLARVLKSASPESLFLRHDLSAQ